MTSTFRKILIGAFSILVAFGLLSLYRLKSVPPGGKVTFAEGTQPIAAPVYVAYFKGYFKDEGLDVDLLGFPTGKLCLDALIGGKADFATAAETPVMFAAFKNLPIKIVATIQRSRENTFCIAKKNQGVHNVADLKGKTVAVPLGTNAEYGFAALLSASKLSLKDLKIVNLRPPEMIGAIADDDIAAVVAWQPHAGRCERALGSNGSRLSFDKVYEETYNIVCKTTTTTQKQQQIVKILSALKRATDYIRSNREDAISIVAKRINMNSKELDQLWPIYHFELNLRSSLLKTMTSEAKWAIESGNATDPIPNMQNMISSASLQLVDSGSVDTIRPK